MNLEQLTMRISFVVKLPVVHAHGDGGAISRYTGSMETTTRLAGNAPGTQPASAPLGRSLGTAHY
jgi:hypothetical protein